MPAKPFRHVLYMVVLLVAVPFVSTVLFFLAIDRSPYLRKRLDLNSFRYYSMKMNYIPDQKLVFIPRINNRTQTWSHLGDWYSPEYNVEVRPIKITRTFKDGFRKNSSNGPTDVLVIGDSYIQIGESDSDTLSERLKQTTGFNTFNLGRDWYGPYQYLQLFRQYGHKLKPSCALFSFYDGNDMLDMQQYVEWARGGFYWDWPAFDPPVYKRYFWVMEDLLKIARKHLLEFRSRVRLSNRKIATDEDERIHPWVGLVRSGGREVPMAFGRAKLDNLALHELERLESVIRDFQRVGNADGIKVFMVFIPTSFEVYSGLLTARSGREILNKARLTANRTSNVEALEGIAHRLGIPFINLLPDFKARATRGELLYYPFESHWNSAGRQAAAEFIGNKL